jgi:plastocyanin
MDRHKLISPNRTMVTLVGGATAAILLMSACGGSATAKPVPSGSGSATAAMPMPAGGSALASDAPAHTDLVRITNFTFAPAVITVVAGAQVTWTNEDAIPHDVFAPPVGLQSRVLNQNDSYPHTFSKPGTYHYICSIHPFMHGTVVVTAK